MCSVNVKFDKKFNVLNKIMLLSLLSLTTIKNLPTQYLLYMSVFINKPSTQGRFNSAECFANQDNREVHT